MIAESSLIITAAEGNSELFNTMSALNKSVVLPREVILVCVGERIDIPMFLDFDLKLLPFPVPSEPFPLAKARNLGAAVSSTDHLIFLDANCIPSLDFIQKMSVYARHYKGFLMAKPLYLMEPVDMDANLARLHRKSRPLPGLPSFENRSVVKSDRHDLFLSMAFAVEKSQFEKTGGFNGALEGCGPYCHDLALRAKNENIPLYNTDAEVFQQTRTYQIPALDEFDDIIANSWNFYKTWGFWPMAEYLSDFEAMGLIKWSPTDNSPIEVMRRPGTRDYENCRELVLPFA